MSTIQVKPHPGLDPAAAPLMIHPVSGGLLDAAGKVPDDGRPWLNDGFTCRMLTDRVVLRADDPAFAVPAVTGFEAATHTDATDTGTAPATSPSKPAAQAAPSVKAPSAPAPDVSSTQ